MLFQDLRSAYSIYLGKEPHARILDYKETEEDEKKCVQVLLHYDTWTRQKLLEAVPLRRRIQYYTIDQATETFATIGIIGKNERDRLCRSLYYQGHYLVLQKLLGGPLLRLASG